MPRAVSKRAPKPATISATVSVPCPTCGLKFASRADLAAHSRSSNDACMSESSMFVAGWRTTTLTKDEYRQLKRPPPRIWSLPPLKRKRVALDPWSLKCHLCRKHFGDSAAFDTHHAVIASLGRCLDGAELKALNYSLKHGVWSKIETSLTTLFRVTGLPSVRADLAAQELTDETPHNLCLDPTDNPPDSDECRCAGCEAEFPSTDAFDSHLKACSRTYGIPGGSHLPA